LDSQNIPEALLGCHLFSELTEAQLDRVRRHSHLIDMVEGESLFFQGDEAVSFYLVLSGRIPATLPRDRYRTHAEPGNRYQ
jgi:CRP-like cAMP-binding protein